jgi:hypothetical protein
MNIKHAIPTIALSVILILSRSGLLAAEGTEEQARDAAKQWLALVDAGNFASSWDTAAGYFKTAVIKEKWQDSLNAVRTPLGAVVSRTFKSAKPAKTLPGAPDGDYVVLQFDTSFANKKTAVETIVPMLEKDGTWRVSGYFIK